MQDKLKEIIKKISIFTTDPDKDWRRLFIALICITVGVFAWSLFFYTKIQQDIADSELGRAKSPSTITTEQESELRDLIIELEEKKKKNSGVVNGTSRTSIQETRDPSRP
jgi:uncharacterized protein YpmS